MRKGKVKPGLWERALLALATVILLAAVRSVPVGHTTLKELDVWVGRGLLQGLDRVRGYEDGIYEVDLLRGYDPTKEYFVLQGNGREYTLRGFEDRGNELWIYVDSNEGRASGLTVFELRRGRGVDTVILRENDAPRAFDCRILMSMDTGCLFGGV